MHYLPKVLACGILDLARRQLLAPLSCGDYKNEPDWQLAAISCGGWCYVGAMLTDLVWLLDEWEAYWEQDVDLYDNITTP